MVLECEAYMTEDEKNPKDVPDGDPNIGDDYGIRNDQVLDICDVIIEELWEKVYLGRQSRAILPDGSRSPSPFTVEQLQNVSATLNIVWDLVQRIMDIDDEIEYILQLEEELEDKEDQKDQDDEDDDEDGSSVEDQ